MGYPSDPVLANVTMTELERVVIKNLFNKRYLKFYIWFIDDTKVLMKKSDVPIVLQALNGFHEDLSFTVETFEDKKSNFSDLMKDRKLHNIFYKDNHTG